MNRRRDWSRSSALALALSLLSACGDPAADRAALEPAAPATAATPAPAPEQPPADDGVLRPEDVAAVQPGPWIERGLSDHPHLITTPCGGARDFIQSTGQRGTLLQRDLDGAGTQLEQIVYRYETDETAQQAFEEYVDARRACPTHDHEQVGDSDEDRQVISTTSYEIVQSEPYLLVAAVTTDCPDCLIAQGHLVALRAGDRMSVLAVVLTDGTSTTLELARRYAQAARGRLEESDDRPDDGLLRAHDIAPAWPGPWWVHKLTDPEGGLSECPRQAAGARMPPLHPPRGAWARLGTAPDGGALAQQSTARYADAQEAEGYFRVLAEAMRACPSETVYEQQADPPRPVLGTATHEVVVDAVDRVITRSAFTCADCSEPALHYVAALQVGPWLTVLDLSAPDEGTARAVVDAAAARLVQVEQRR